MTEEQIKKQIETIILGTLVVQNKQSIWRAVDKLYELQMTTGKKIESQPVKEIVPDI
jgi:hypothetical protein